MEKLYKDSIKTVYGYMYSLCGNAELANDLTQETYLKAIESIDRYNGQCKFSVWLCQIGKHLWYQYLAKQGREIPAGDDIFILKDADRHQMSAEDTYIATDELHNLFDIIVSLDESYRQVLLLRLVFELSFKEIGLYLSRTENWARVTYYRGKEKVLNIWENRYGKDN